MLWLEERGLGAETMGYLMVLHCLSSTCSCFKKNMKVRLGKSCSHSELEVLGTALNTLPSRLSSDAKMEGLWRGAELGSQRPFSSCRVWLWPTLSGTQLVDHVTLGTSSRGGWP